MWQLSGYETLDKREAWVLKQIQAITGKSVGFPCLHSMSSFGLDDKKDTFEKASVTSTQLESYGREIGKVASFDRVTSTQLESYGREIGKVDSFGRGTSAQLESYGREIGKASRWALIPSAETKPEIWVLVKAWYFEFVKWGMLLVFVMFDDFYCFLVQYVQVGPWYEFSICSDAFCQPHLYSTVAYASSRLQTLADHFPHALANTAGRFLQATGQLMCSWIKLVGILWLWKRDETSLSAQTAARKNGELLWFHQVTISLVFVVPFAIHAFFSWSRLAQKVIGDSPEAEDISDHLMDWETWWFCACGRRGAFDVMIHEV